VRDLIQQRMDEYGTDADLATFIVVEPGDPLDSLDAQLGFSVLSNRLDGKRHGDPGFTPSFEVLEEHPGCYEMVFVLADYGDGVLVFLNRLHHLVAQECLQVILWIQAGQLADVAIDAVGLRNHLAVHLQRGDRKERSLVAESGPVLARDAVILERDAADVKRQTRGLAASAVEIEVGQLELWHMSVLGSIESSLARVCFQASLSPPSRLVD
jgi:hypothetical protein